MSLQADSKKKWITPVAIFGGLVVVLLLSNQTVKTPEGYKVVTTNQEYAAQIQVAHDITKPIFDKADNGESLSELEKDQLIKAAILIDSANRLHPESAIPFLGAGKAYLLAGSYDLAEARLQQAINNAEFDKNPGAKETGWEAYFRLSELRFKLADYQGAYEAADKAVKEEPSAIMYLIARARAALQLKKLDQADMDLNAALILERDNKDALALHRLLELENPNRFGKVEVPLLIAQAREALGKKDLDTADKSLHLALALDPGNIEAAGLHKLLKSIDSAKYGDAGH
jgi:tetratricopeptide (TPR) repeat protein